MIVGMEEQKERSKDFVGADIREKIKELGRLWRNSPSRPCVSPEILDKWEHLIVEWSECDVMPLIVRKGNQRGQELKHSTGRRIIVSDNTFALWVCRNVLDGKTFDLSDIKKMLGNKEIPMVYALSKEDRQKASHTKTLGEHALSGSDGKFKLCHIEPVGINSRKPIEEMDICDIVECFKRYANPKNMFVLPKEIGGLGEVREFIDEQRY